jgi:CNT family concentrative nucleoside transporter
LKIARRRLLFPFRFSILNHPCFLSGVVSWSKSSQQVEGKRMKTDHRFLMKILIVFVVLMATGGVLSGVGTAGSSSSSELAAQAGSQSQPPSTDMRDRAQAAPVPLSTRLIGLLGILVLLGLAFLCSNDRRDVKWRIIVWGFGLQVVLAFLILRTSPGRWFFDHLGDLIKRLLAFSDEGARFVFGELAGTSLGVIFAFRVLPTIIFISAFFSILYYLGVLQKIVLAMAKVMAWTMKASGAESLSASANVFMGQTEAPLIIAPYLPSMTRSELLCVMIGGMATISGGVMAAYIGMGINPVYLLTGSTMAAPAALMMSKILIPEKEEPMTAGIVKIEVKTEDRNVIEAAARGAGDGARLAINVAAMLVAFIALIALVNAVFGFLHAKVDFIPANMQTILGWVFSPLAFVMGVPTADMTAIGNLFGQKLILNEFVAYAELTKVQAALHPRSVMIVTYALCGFANFASVGIQIGGIGGLAPTRRSDLAELGLRAVLGGFLATCLTATIAALIS